MTFNPVPKTKYKRKKPTRKKRGEFSKDTREAIYERDNWSCRMCGAPASQIHHCFFKSRGGRGVYTNGVTLCQDCHSEVHQSSKLTDYWMEHCKSLYGENYHKDSWD